MMRTQIAVVLTLCLVALFAPGSFAEKKIAFPPLGANVSECARGNPPLWLSNGIKTITHRDIPRTIAANFGALTGAGGIDSAVLQNKLSSVMNGRTATCKLTLKPSGRIAEVKVIRTSGDPELDKKAIALLKMNAPYGCDNSSTDNRSYRVELPKLLVVPY